MKRLLTHCLALCAFVHTGLFAFPQQQIEVNGKVVDQDSKALPSATIEILNEKTKQRSTVMADSDGLFVLRSLLQGENYSIYAHHLGYTTDSITNFRVSGTNKNTILFRLISNVDVLDEVVVVGYGTQKASTVTGSIVDVKGDVLERAPVMNFTNTLAGRLPGLVATTGSGEPGSDNSTLRIRGANTLGDNSPLIVVDGIANRSIERLNPQDIESVTILKDASAAIYGSQAANAVILVTTKNGRIGKPQITLTRNQGWSQPTIIPHTADAAEYAQMLNEISHYAGQQPKYSEDELELFRNGTDIWRYPNTDWYSATFNTVAPQQKTAININGGSE